MRGGFCFMPPSIYCFALHTAFGGAWRTHFLQFLPALQLPPRAMPQNFYPPIVPIPACRVLDLCFTPLDHAIFCWWRDNTYLLPASSAICLVGVGRTRENACLLSDALFGPGGVVYDSDITTALTRYARGVLRAACHHADSWMV